MLLMSLSNHSNDEENEKIKQAAGLTSKTKTLNMQHAFRQFFAINANIVKLDQNGNAIKFDDVCIDSKKLPKSVLHVQSFSFAC